jgi:hypothetical protein
MFHRFSLRYAHRPTDAPPDLPTCHYDPGVRWEPIVVNYYLQFVFNFVDQSWKGTVFVVTGIQLGDQELASGD